MAAAMLTRTGWQDRQAIEEAQSRRKVRERSDMAALRYSGQHEHEKQLMDKLAGSPDWVDPRELAGTGAAHLAAEILQQSVEAGASLNKLLAQDARERECGCVGAVDLDVCLRECPAGAP